jgi:hypothetical protein
MALKTSWELDEGYAYLTNRLRDLETDAQFVGSLYASGRLEQDEFDSIIASINCATSHVQASIAQQGWTTKEHKIGPKRRCRNLSQSGDCQWSMSGARYP